MQQKLVTIIGGTGFVGRYVVKQLAKSGYTIQVIARNAPAAQHLKTAGVPGQIVLQCGNLGRPETLEGKLDGSFAVINLVGILFERNHQSFTKLHSQGPERLAKMAKEAGAERFIHMSAIGVDSAQSKYARTKIMGEKAVMAAFPEATVLRPSIIFGPEDQFYNKFASMTRYSPILPLIDGGKTKFQPVYVQDVARAVDVALHRAETKGQTYELGGPRVYSFKEILEFILDVTGKKRCLLNIPAGMANIMALFAEILPTPPLTQDQVRTLAYDNLVGKDAKGFAELGITPMAAEVVVPEYLERFRPGAMTHQRPHTG